MKLLKNKKAGEGGEKALAEMIALIILFALLVFVLFWYPELKTIIIKIFDNFF